MQTDLPPPLAGESTDPETVLRDIEALGLQCPGFEQRLYSVM